ncbi:RNA polymerase sigma factor sigA [Tanacetum coccineum]
MQLLQRNHPTEILTAEMYLKDEGTKHELSVEALLLLQKSLLEKQWEISTSVNTAIATPAEKSSKKVHFTGSQISARKRRLDAQKKTLNNCSDMQLIIGPELFRNQFKGRVKDELTEVLLTHSEVIVLSKKIKTGLNLEEQKLRLKTKLGSEPSEEQLATPMRISQTKLRTIQIQCTLARHKLTLSNVRLVMSVVQRYDNMGAQMADLIQVMLL